MVRSQRRHLADRIAKRRYRHHSWVEHIGLLRKTNSFYPPCDCSWCRGGKNLSRKISKEDKIEMTQGLN